MFNAFTQLNGHSPLQFIELPTTQCITFDYASFSSKKFSKSTVF